jgi:FkbM family methyltransferase
LRKPHFIFRPENAVRRAWQRLTGDPGRPSDVTLPWGAVIRVDPLEENGRAIWSTGVYDLAVSETLWRLTDPGDRAADIGANIGYFTCLLAQRCAPAGRVVAFEPGPEVFTELRANAARWNGADLAPIELRELALSRAPGIGRLHLGAAFATNRGIASLERADGEAVEVSVDTLDRQWSPDTALDVVKLDVEGHELAVLEGASETLPRIRDIVYEDFAPQPSAVRRLLERNGYTVLRVGVGWLRPRLLDPDAPTDLGDHVPPNFLATRAQRRCDARLRGVGWRSLGYARRGRRVHRARPR